MIKSPLAIISMLTLAAGAIHAEAPKYPDYWNDPALSAKIDQGIEKNRKSDAVIRVTDAAGKPLPGARVSVEQIDSSFHFGANLFMLGSYPTPELNRRYEEAFCKLFNGATVPFYWNDLEPEQGKPRFAADSPVVARRPPPDATVAFCESHGLRIHGHPLVWNHDRYYVPNWLPADTSKSIPLFEEHIRQIAERYGSRIQRWDTVNEVVAQKTLLPGVPPDYDRLAFTWAERYLPADASLYINETTACWDGNLQRYTELIQRLLADKARISGIGLQFHIMDKGGLEKVVAGTLHTPGKMLEALENYSRFGLPLHISEITLACPEDDEAGQALQAQVARSYYRLWFSCPAVNSITWWNFPDGGAAPGEDRFLSGLLTSDLKPKAGYNALYELIHREWRTNVSGNTNADGSFAVRGFHGKYKVRVEPGGISREFSIAPGKSNQLTLQVSSPSTTK